MPHQPPRQPASEDSRPRPATPPTRVVGVGASAGGLEAFTQLLRVVPADSGMAFVLVSHLSPTHRSELPRILSSATAMPVREVEDGVEVEPDHVYVLPANRSLNIAEGRLHLAGRDGGEAHPTAIDHFFQSLAVDQATRAVGIILSGTGSDGTAGLEAIQARGGPTYTQDPAQAAFGAMPESASRTGAADFTLSIAEIGRALAELSQADRDALDPNATLEAGAEAPGPDEAVEHPGPAYSEAEAEALDGVIQILRIATGVDFHHYKRPSLARRVRHRVEELGLADFVAYLPRLRSDPEEVATLFDTVLIQVTGFFREPATFQTLQGIVIPPLLTGRPAGVPLRAWVVGCATGQEAYSLAISFLEVEAGLGLESLVRVFASDLSPTGLSQARTGLYSREEAKGLSPERVERFFSPVDHGYRVAKRLREMCVFARHDITRDPPFAQLDLVLCSNVLIYLDQVLQRQVLQNLHYALKPNGYLVLGPAETTTGLEGLFSPLDRQRKIYLRRHALGHPHVSRGGAVGRSPRDGPPPLPAVTALQWSTAELQRAAEQVLFRDYPTASVLVTPELEVLHYQGATGRYLETPSGGPTVQLLRLAHPDLRLPLGRLLRRAREEHVPVMRRGLRLETEGKTRSVSLSVLPVSLSDTREEHYLVVFQDLGRPAALSPAVSSAGADESARVLELEAELAENKDYLQSVIEQQDAIHAELQAAYEASLSVNEEYQSTNEELESAKEELQSLNEELTTVNEQLHQRHGDLEARTAELKTLLESVDMPMLLVSDDLRLRAFNSRAADSLRLTPALIGRDLAEGQFPLPVAELRQLAARATSEQAIQERELQDAAGRWQALRVWPVQPAGNGATVAVALVDITKLKGDVADAAAGRSYSEAIVETVMHPLVVLDDQLRMVHGNAAFHRMFRTEAETILGLPIAGLGQGDWTSTELVGFLGRARQAPAPVAGPEITLDLPRLGRRTYQISAGSIRGEAEGQRRLLLALEDITVRKLAEASEMETSRMRAVGELAGGVAHEINNQMTTVLGYADYVLIQTGEDDPRREDLARIVKAGRRSAAVTGQLLAFSRRQILDPVVLDLNTLVAGSEDLLRRAAGPDIAVEVVLGEAVGRVRVDQAQFEQVLMNLTLNARDAMEGEGTLRIETSRVVVDRPASSRPEAETVPAGAYARIAVTDTGAGMDPDTQSRIFEPFFTTKPVGEGTGLGLSSVYGTVKQSGGLIWVDSEPGRGATFTIDLPQVHADSPAKPPAAPAELPGGTETIMVVEDEEPVRAWIGRILRDRGYRVLEVADGREALRTAGQDRAAVDLVLSDVALPGLDGVELQANLGELRPELPVLLMSGFAREELVRRGRMDRESALLHKPFDAGVLAVEVRQALDRARPQA